MNLYIRVSPRPVNFIHSIDELRSLIELYIPGRPLLIGDISSFHKNAIYLLLKFIENNPSIDCYSSTDIDNPILLSRFVRVVKEPFIINPSIDSDAYQESTKGYFEVEKYLGMLTDKSKLIANKVPSSVLSMLQSI